MAVLGNHYSVLGLASAAGPNLTDEEISKAFKRMALRLHPDKNPRNPNAHSNFQRLLTSYNILKNPISRKEFDHLLQVQHQRQNQAQSCHHQTCNKRQRDEQQQSSMKRSRHPMGPRTPSEPPKKPAFTMTEFFMEFDRIRKLVAEGGVHKVARLLTSYNILKNPISGKEFDHLLQVQHQRQNQAQSCHHQTCNKRQREEQQQSFMKRPRHPMGPRMPSEPPKKPAFTMTEFFMEFDRIRKLVAEGGVHTVAVNEGYNHIRL
eukprot:XP_015576950.1 uncharacterized protein LOC8266910 [Ricinus communis]